MEAPTISMTRSDITQLLVAASDGNEGAMEALLPAVYERLRTEARRQLRRERSDHTLNTTALVHEAYLKLVDQKRIQWKNRNQFFWVAAQAMRRILVDYARGRARQKRGAGFTLVPIQEAAVASSEQPEMLVALDEALKLLEQQSERQARVVECRFFAGYSVSETADILEISERTVKREWAVARTRLFQTLQTMAEA
ncbi:MAG: sigma-70 family RNA polymerase sigma factor [Rhodothermales bacterium]|nr:sigma-70 family RNA polymerase sigma factor [Rhodothermales bacterium]MBO6778579.1 sigma-70 family RNA polymerase sigma factor [Rhodothermales bacterium]